MKTTKAAIIIGICFSMIMCSLSGCSKDAPVSEEITVSKKTSAETSSKKDKKDKLFSTTTMSTDFIEKPEEDEEEEVIWDAADNADLPLFEEMPTSKLNLELIDIEDKSNILNNYCGLSGYKDSFSGLWGYLDRNMNVAIEPQFFEIYNFKEGYAGVYDGYNWGFIDTKGNYLIKPKYSEICEYRDFSIYDVGFENGMALVADAQNNDEYYSIERDDCYYVIDYEGNERLIDYNTYISLFYDKLSFCNGITYVNDLGGEVKILNNDGTINSRKSSLFQDIAAYESYSKYTLVDKNHGSDDVINHSNSKLVFMRSFPPAYVAAVIITDVDKSFVFDLKDLPEFQQLRSIQLCDNLLITKREINDIEQSAVYDYNKKLIINYKYKDILPVVVNGNAEYFVCSGNNGDSIVVDKNGNSNELLDKYCHLDVMTSYDGKAYLLGIYKTNNQMVDIIDFTSKNVIATFVSDKMNLLWNGSYKSPKYEYAGIHNGVVLIATEKMFIVYDYINDYLETVYDSLDTKNIFLDTGVCNLNYENSYYKITGFPIE